MDALRPGHAHRSSSDRLLSNYLDAQKALSTSLLTLLSHSHSSTSSLLAYTTSSPGVNLNVRRAVRHAAFEGPLSASLVENPEAHMHDDAPESTGWASYVSSLDQFRKDLKQIHLLEEEMSRVRRDREILVTRLIKTTKARPKKADLTAMSAEYGQRSPSAMSSRGSTLSLSSVGSFGTKESKRASKLAEAQAELLGCEEHLRGLEVRIESERNNVMSRGLEERFRAMEAVGRMWVRQAKRGLDDMDKHAELPRDAFELDSNGSIAPSQSASQIGYEDQHSRRGGVPFPRSMGQGSITGSIAEEEEGGSSDDGNGGHYTVHENRRGVAGSAAGRSNGPSKPAPIGVPSVTAPRNGGRRAASDVGYTAPQSRLHSLQGLRRTHSNDRANNNERADSDASSVRDMSGGGGKKKGFFSSLKRIFKGDPDKKNQSRSGRDSPGPVYQSSKGGWSTRTDTNIRRSNSMYGGGRGGDDSSDDEDNGNFVAVSNNRNSFSADNIGRVNGSKRSSMPIASGLIPNPPSRKSVGAGQRSDSQSTLTARRALSPEPTGAKTPTGRPGSRASTVRSAGAAPALGSVARTNTVKSTSTAAPGGMTRSNTVKSTASTATAKSSPGKRIRPNGSIARSGMHTQQASEGRTIMSIVDMDVPPMPEVPKAPKSHVTPQMELPKAPGSSLVPKAQPTANGAPKPLARSNSAATGGLARSNSSKRVSQAPKGSPPRSTTPLPPSRMLSPPLKSALRPTSPNPNDNKSVLSEPAHPMPEMFSITAPGPVKLPVEQKPAPAPVSAPMVSDNTVRPPGTKRNSFHSMTTADGESVYESAEEGGNENEDDESSSDEEHDESKYQVYENDRNVQAGMNVGPPAIERIPSDRRDDDSGDESDDTATGAQRANTAEAEAEAPQLAKRKSVRMNVPDSPAVTAPPPVTDPSIGHDYSTEDRAASPEPERERPGSAAWSSRIGQADVDSEDERDPEYMNARKGLKQNTGQWEKVKAAASPKRSKSVKSSASKSGSVKGRK